MCKPNVAISQTKQKKAGKCARESTLAFVGASAKVDPGTIDPSPDRRYV
jgi:hypothetical protein